MLAKNFPGRLNDRRIKALVRLEETDRTGKTLVHKTSLDEDSKRRVKKEIKILEAKIITPEEARGIRTKKDRSENKNQGG